MSNLTIATEDLTAYNNGDLELFIHNDGSVYASQSAIARMCNVSETSIRRYLADRPKTECYMAQTLTNSGGKRSNLHPIETIVACAKKYNPDLMEKFATMGATAYLYQLAGYKVKVTEPDHIPAEMTTQQMEFAIQAMTEKLKLTKYCQQRPNFANRINAVLENDGKALPGKMTLEEFEQVTGVTVPSNYRSVIGRALSENTRSLTGEAPTRRTIKTPNGGSRGYDYNKQVCEYPSDLVPDFVHLCQQRGLVS